MNFINPYNFFPMTSGNSRVNADSTDSTNEKLLSGVIQYSVKTKTPVFIPNTSNPLIFSKNPEEDEKNDLREVHKTYDFFSYNNLKGKKHGERTYYKPVIPGSEIRGMFRSNFEILTNSCMSALDSDMQLSKRTMESYLPGLLFRNTEGESVVYDLYKADSYKAINVPVPWMVTEKDKVNFTEGEKVKFTKVKSTTPLACKVEKYNNNTNRNGTDEGYIIKGEKSPGGKTKKCYCHVFVLNEEKPLKTNVKISLLENVLEAYASNKLNSKNEPYKQYSKQFKEFKAGSGNKFFPVYYSIIKDSNVEKLFMSPACKTREIYDNTLKSLAGDFAPCNGKKGYCETCNLFGTVVDNDSKSSKIRFSDLVAENKEKNKDYYVEQPITLPELSSPKLNNMEFYLSRPQNAYFWTYDYYIDKNGRLHIANGKLAGRKFYWHQNIDNNYNPREKRGKRNITIRPLRSGVTFEGKLFFERITQTTLNKLIFLINAGEEETNIDKKKYGYKIGMAKPLGLGSIVCKVDKVYIKSYVIENKQVVQKFELYDKYNNAEVSNSFKGNILKNYKKMTEFDGIKLTKGEVFSYPKININSKGYEWFTKNHVGINNKMPISRKKMKFAQYLPAMNPRVQNVN